MDYWTFEERAGREDPVPPNALRRRPSASWVMGRSARWHDPDVLAELRMHQLAEEDRASTVLGTAAGLGSPAGLLVGIRAAVRSLRRRPRR